MFFMCVCVEFKHAGEAMLLEKSTENWENPTAQKTNGYDANSLKQRWVWTLHPDIFSMFSWSLCWTSHLEDWYLSFRDSLTPLLTYIHTRTPSPALTPSSSFDALWIIHCLSTDVERVLCFSQTVWTFQGQHNDVSCACLGLVFIHLSMDAWCVCVALLLGWMGKGEEVSLTRLFEHLMQVVISGFVL